MPGAWQKPSSVALRRLEEWVRRAPAELSPDDLGEILHGIQAVIERGGRAEREATVKRLLATFEGWPTRSRSVEALAEETVVIVGFLDEVLLRVPMLLSDIGRLKHRLYQTLLETKRKALRAVPEEDLTLDCVSEIARGIQDTLKNSPGLFDTPAGRETEQAMWRLVRDHADRIAGQMRTAFGAGDHEKAREYAAQFVRASALGWIRELGRSGLGCPDPEALAIYCITSLRAKNKTKERLACDAYTDAMQRWTRHQDGQSARERFYALLSENSIDPSQLEQRAPPTAPDGPEAPNRLRWKGTVHQLPPMLWRLLDYMWERDRAPEEELVENVWGHDQFIGSTTVRSAVSRLNNHLLRAEVDLGWSLATKAGDILKVRHQE